MTDSEVQEQEERFGVIKEAIQMTQPTFNMGQNTYSLQLATYDWISTVYPCWEEKPTLGDTRNVLAYPKDSTAVPIAVNALEDKIVHLIKASDIFEMVDFERI